MAGGDELPPRKEMEPCEEGGDWERGSSGLPGCGAMPCPWGTAALPKNPSGPHSQPRPQCPLVPPYRSGLGELAARLCSPWEWLWCHTLSPPRPLPAHKPELWQGQTRGLGRPLSSLLQGLTPRSQLGLWPPQGAASQARGSAAPGENNGTSLPRPLSQGQQWQEPESEPPELISPPRARRGLGQAGGRGLCDKGSLPARLSALQQCLRSHPAICTHPRGRRAGGTQGQQHFGDSESPPWLLPGLRLSFLTGFGSPHCRLAARSPPPAALCLGVPGHCLRGRDPARQLEVTSISPASSLCARGGRWPRRKQLLSRGTRDITAQNWCPPARFSFALQTLWG